MILTRWLTIGSLIGLVHGGALGCAARECTDEERAEVDADDDATCHRIVPFEKFTDEAKQNESEDWESGDDLLIRGDIREIDIEKASGDQVRVSFQAQVDLAEDRSEKVVLQTMEDLEHSLTKDGSTIVVSADRGDSKANLGAKAIVELPEDFDGNIEIDIGGDLPGAVEIRHVGSASKLVLDKDSLGDLLISNALTLTDVTVNCKGDIKTGTFDSEDLKQVALHTTIGDIETSFSKPPSNRAVIAADFGDIDIELPDTGDYTMQVEASDGVNIAGAPSSCEIDDDDDNAQSMTCNAGDSSDHATFDITADGSATIGFR